MCHMYGVFAIHPPPTKLRRTGLSFFPLFPYRHSFSYVIITRSYNCLPGSFQYFLCILSMGVKSIAELMRMCDEVASGWHGSADGIDRGGKGTYQQEESDDNQHWGMSSFSRGESSFGAGECHPLGQMRIMLIENAQDYSPSPARPRRPLITPIRSPNPGISLSRTDSLFAPSYVPSHRTGGPRLPPAPTRPVIFGGGEDDDHASGKKDDTAIDDHAALGAPQPKEETKSAKDLDDYEDDLWNEEAIQLAEMVEEEGEYLNLFVYRLIP